MSLAENFNKTIERASFNRKLNLTPYALHQVLVGPPRSGKTVMAGEYAEVLAEEGLAADKPATFISGFDVESETKMKAALEQAAGGVLVIDEIDKVDNIGHATHTIIQLIESRKCTLVLTGPADSIRRMIQSEPGLHSRLPVITETERSFTREECAAYDSISPQDRKLKRAEEKKLRLIKEKMLKDTADMGLRRDIAPMRKIRIVPKGYGS